MNNLKKYLTPFLPVVLIGALFWKTMDYTVLGSNQGDFFDSIFLFLGLALVVTLAGVFDHFLKKWNRKKIWFIRILMVLISYYSYFLLFSDSFEERDFGMILGIFWLLIVLSMIVYLLSQPFKFLFKLTKKIKWKWVVKFVAYVERLLLPVYLFPIKMVTYSTYYLTKFLIKAIIEMVKIIIDLIKYPFRSFRNFLKSLFIVGLVVYVAASTFVIIDYIRTHYGYYNKFFCSAGTTTKLKKSVVRIVGGYSEGTGFFISPNEVLTNFHVINGEPSPKIIFADGSFVTPNKIVGDKEADLALLTTEKNYPNLLMPLSNDIDLVDEEPVIATGFAMGTDLTGKATILRGNYIDFRKSKTDTVGYFQTNISLVKGMSGGPLTDQCGKVVGINTLGLAGLSLFISGSEAKDMILEFDDKDIKKIKVDPSKSPEEAVTAFYTYLSARRMQDGFDLLSKEYLQKTNFEEWTSRFTNILDVEVFTSKADEKLKNLVLVKFGTKNWVDNEMETHFYEGTWETILEDGVYKMLKSNIKEIKDPDYGWFYE